MRIGGRANSPSSTIEQSILFAGDELRARDRISIGGAGSQRKRLPPNSAFPSAAILGMIARKERRAGGAPPGPTRQRQIVRAPRFIVHTDVLSWGRTTREPQLVAAPRFRDELTELIGDIASASKLAIGMRRSYGDSCLNGAGALIDMRGLDRFISFDPATGILCAEAGVNFSDI